MPQIVEYNAPQGIGLNPTEVGIESTAAAARRVNAAFSETAQVKEEAGRRIGAGIREAGDAASQYITHQEVSRAAASFAKFKLGEIQNWNQQSEKADPNDPTVGGKYMEGLEGRLQQFQQGFLTEGGQKWADAQVISFRDHMAKTTASDMAAHAGNAAVINQRSLVNTLANTTYLNPTPEGIKDAFGTLDSTTETLIANNPNLRNSGKTDELRYRLTQSSKEAIVKSAVEGYINKTGQVPKWASSPELAPYLSKSEADQFEKHAQAQERYLRSAAKSDRAEAEHTARMKIQSDLLQFNLSTRDDQGNIVVNSKHYDELKRIVANNPTGAVLERKTVEAAFNALDTLANRMNKSPVRAEQSRVARQELLNRIDSEGADRLTDINEIDARADKLTDSDLKYVRAEFHRSNTAEGRDLAKARSEFFKAHSSDIDSGSMYLGPTALGKIKISEAQQEARRLEQTLKAQGKDPHLLYDDKSDLFFGNSLGRYRITMQDAIDYVNKAQEAQKTQGAQPSPGQPAQQPASARKQGESFNDWLVRTGKIKFLSTQPQQPAQPVVPLSR